MKIIWTLLLFLGSFLAVNSQDTADSNDVTSEIAIYNELWNELYNVGQCTRFITPPFYACCNFNTHMSVEDHVACCLDSDIPERYRIYCQDCVNFDELDTLKLLVESSDTLYPFDFEEFRDYLLNEIDTSSEFYSFIDHGFFNQKKAGFNMESMQHEVNNIMIRNKDDDPEDYVREKAENLEVSFVSKEEMTALDKRRRIGKYNGNLQVGKIDLSRVYFNEKKNLAFFYFAFLGQNNCGELNVCLIRNEGKQWKVEQKILLDSF